MLMNSSEYLATVDLVRQEIKSAQYHAAVHVNTTLILLYHRIGHIINEHKIWGNKFIENLLQISGWNSQAARGIPCEI